MKIKFAALAFAAFAIAVGNDAFAQSYPNKTIRLIVPSTPGSPTDVMARLVAQNMTQTLGQPVVVEPRPGGGGIIGTKAVISAEPDGYTLLFTEGAKHLMTPALYENVGFDPLKDLTPVATAGGGVFLMVIAPDIPAKTVQDFVSYAKANPGKINFGFGQGTLPHMLGASLKAASGTDINLVPYKGGAQAVADMLGGHIQMNFGTTATLLALIKQGKLRPLAVTGDKRSPELPDTPTMAESGFPKLTLRYWMGVWAPPNTPKAIVETLNASILAGLKTPELLGGLNRAGFEPLPVDANAITGFMQSESPKWLDVARTSGVKGD